MVSLFTRYALRFFPVRGGVLLACVLPACTPSTQAACDPCADFGSGVSWGVVAINPLQEASGLAASRRNPGVLWTHNDGSGQNLYAIGTNGARLATIDLNQAISDLEDVAAGPGPVSGVDYLYLGDIGGSGNPGDVRASIRIIRLPDPLVDLAWATNPRSFAADGVDVFTLNYPDGAFDAESLLVDPVTGDVLVVTKQPGSARWYRANLNSFASGATATLQFVRSVAFGVASAGDMSADGTQIILRREDFALLWTRCDGESINTALSRTGQEIPVIGPPTEPNGEAIALLPDGTGYLTISEGASPTLFHFQAHCPAAPVLTLEPQDQSVFAGGTAQFHAQAVGYPPPVYEWRFNDQLVNGQNGASLTLSGVVVGQAGMYEVTVTNAHGQASATALLMVRPKPDLRITEVMSSPAASPTTRADWWELTNFDSQPVNLAGWRFNDGSGGLADPFVFPDGLSIAPRETIVLIENLTPADFRAWWGAGNVPASVQVVRYTGNGLSFSANGDQITLWDASTADATNFVARAVFGSAGAGVSFNYDPVTSLFGGASQFGVNGVFVAAGGTDLGSPGRYLAPVVSPVLTSQIVNDQLRVGFDAAVGRIYRLESVASVASGAWEPTGDSLVATNNSSQFFAPEMTGDGRYFRVGVE